MKYKSIALLTGIFLAVSVITGLVGSNNEIRQIKPADNTSQTYKVTVITTYLKCSHTKIEELTVSEKPVSGTVNRETNKYCDHHYIVKDYLGKIGVFSLNSPDESPIRIIYADIDSFPKADVELLRSGIIANSDSELQSIIEDYSS